MSTTTTTTTVVIDGHTVTADLEIIRLLLTADTATLKPEKPKAETPKKAAKKATPKAKAEEPKAEVSPKREGYPYTKGGAIIQYAANNTLKANNLRRVNNAIKKLTEAGFCVSWKRVGGWLYIQHFGKSDHKTTKEYQAVKMAAGWEFIKGQWVDKTMLADYEDNFRK